MQTQIRTRTNCCAKFTSALGSASEYAITGVKYVATGLKVATAAATIVSVPLCYWGRSLFYALGLINYASGSVMVTNPTTLVILGCATSGTFLFAVASRTTPILNGFFPPTNIKNPNKSATPASNTEIKHYTSTFTRYPENILTLISEYAQQTPPSTCRWVSSWMLCRSLDVFSTLQMAITDMSTFLGLKQLLAFLPYTSEVYVALTLVGLFNFNYGGFNLAPAYKNSRKFERAINNGQYDFNTCTLLSTILCMLPAFFSIPTSGYFTAQSIISEIPHLNDLTTTEQEIFSIVTATVNLFSSIPMTIPSIYQALSEGIRIKVPNDNSEWVLKMTCGATGNKWVVLRNGIIFPCGILDNLSQVLFCIQFAYTLHKLFPKLEPHSPLTIFIISMVGLALLFLHLHLLLYAR